MFTIQLEYINQPSLRYQILWIVLIIPLTDELGYGSMFDDEDDEIDTTIPDDMDLVDDDFDDLDIDEE